MYAPFHRPEPVFRPRADYIDLRRDPDHYARRLYNGESLRLVDAYGYGADILDALRYGLGPIPDSLTGEELRFERRRRRRLAAGLLVPIDRGDVAIRGVDPIPLMADLYRDVGRCWLPLVDIQALRTADRRFRQGVLFAVLGHALHPWYGTYAPKRTAHLELFGTWLSQYEGPTDTAIDVGTGCGVLAFMLARAGFADVRAVDINPNAVESVRRDLARQRGNKKGSPMSNTVELYSFAACPFAQRTRMVVDSPAHGHPPIDGMVMASPVDLPTAKISSTLGNCLLFALSFFCAVALMSSSPRLIAML